MTLYHGSHDYHPCEYDFDAVWSQFEEEEPCDPAKSVESHDAFDMPIKNDDNDIVVEGEWETPAEVVAENHHALDMPASNESENAVVVVVESKPEPPAENVESHRVLEKAASKRKDNNVAEAEYKPPVKRARHRRVAEKVAKDENNNITAVDAAAWEPPAKRVKSRIPEPADTSEENDIIIVDGEWEPPRRRDCRRCETKVMLQTADGQLFNKYFEEEDIRDFARRFKTLRCEYGFSQADVGSALGRRYGSDFSQTTISRFEGLVLSHSNMCKLRPPVEQWLSDIQAAIENGIPFEQLRRACKNGNFWPSQGNQAAASLNSSLVPPFRKRKKRTSLDASQRLALESYFEVNQRPDNHQLADVAQTLDLEFEVIRVWFCNRRQKIRKEIPKIKSEIDSEIATTSYNH